MPARKKTTTKRSVRKQPTSKRGARTTRAARKSAAQTGTVERRATQPKGLSLHLGLNLVDKGHYAGWSGALAACEFDAHDMAAIAASKGMRPTVLLTRDATRAKVLAELRRAAARLEAGDFFLLTYSGHGGQVPDVTGDEPDRADETWCLYDGQLLDDELYLALSRFAQGVRVFVLSDSCHSGTVTRARVDAPVHDPYGALARVKLLPPTTALETYHANRRFYDGLQRRVAAEAERDGGVDPDEALANVPPSSVAADPRLGGVAGRFRPSVILISGCQDNQTSLDGARNGAFTGALLDVWRSGAFVGNYGRFHAHIKAALPPSQTPNLFTLGDVRTFITQQPFQLSERPGTRVSAARARAYVDAAPVPPARGAAAARRTRGGGNDAGATAFDTAKEQAAVVGSDVLSFVPGVTAERREAIVNSSLLAQLVASKQVPDAMKVYEWYDAYFEVLTNVGWVVQDRGFAEYDQRSKNFEAHKAIIEVATALLGAAPAALAIVTKTLEALQSMNEDTPWITIFNRESQSARTARFQIGLAEQDANGQFFVNVLAFGFEARTTMTQVLFFRANKQDVTLRHYSGRVTINTTVLDQIGDALKAKIAGHAASFISHLPDL